MPKVDRLCAQTYRVASGATPQKPRASELTGAAAVKDTGRASYFKRRTQRWTGLGATKMGIFSWIILGLIAGALGKLLMPGKQGGGWIVTILLGIVGAFVGGW